METHHSVRKLSIHHAGVAILAILVTSLAQGTMGCFPINKVFKASCLWTQSISIESRYHLDFCQHSAGGRKGSRVTFRPEGKGTEKMEHWHWDCVKAFSDQHYLVKKSNSKKTLGYQCLKFSPLTAKVVRQEQSELVKQKNEVDCLSATYTLEERVLVASRNLDPVTCPLAGGYQILMHLPDSIPNDKKCLGSAASYKPHLQFQCDQFGSSHVLADLGPFCTPGDLQESAPMEQRHLAHLDCVDYWQENRDTSKEFTTVLLRMQGSNLTFWCLQLKHVPNSAHTSVTSPEESLHQSFLTFDGRCTPEMTSQHSVPTRSDMFGKLAAFIPGDEVKCQEPSYLNDCKAHTVSKCQESTDCPKTCGRCLEKIKLPSSCSIPSNAQGTWESFFSGKNDLIILNEDSIKTSMQGDFKCHSDAEDTIGLVQIGQHSTCMPYYTCAKLSALAPGLLSYQMFPVNRDDLTGKVHTCAETRKMNNKKRPREIIETATLLQPLKLKETSCDIMANMNVMMSPDSQADCRLTVHECSGTCQTFNISLQAETCDNKTAEEAGLLTEHTCLAVLDMKEITAVLTRSPDTKQYLCWIRLSTSFVLLSPENCNREQIEKVMRDESLPNPLHVLKKIWPKAHSDAERNGSLREAFSSTAFGVALLSLALKRL